MLRRSFSSAARRASLLATCVVLAVAAIPRSSAAADGSPFPAMHWRGIGPFRGGRTVAVTGTPGRAAVFYMAPVDGGIWKTTDAGRTWRPIFDGADTGSIGALAVAPSDPDVVYAGSGEGLRRPDLSTGDGMYRSRDGGATWTHLGLRDGQQIAAIAVDPRDAARLYVAVLGHPFGPNAERGLYRSTDGGATFVKVLGSGDDAGAVTVAVDARHPETVYAALWSSRNSPWNLTQVYQRYDESGLYKSDDGGTTWSHLTAGLPAAVGRIGIAISPVDSSRLYAIVAKPGDACGIYRSDDAGATWTMTDDEERVCGRTEDFAGITADPRARDTVYSANTSTYRSTDGGRTWTGIKGAPGGDDYHTVWIAPDDPQTIALGSDQGAIVSVNGGATWSSWYNQPTAQFYHVATDDRFPYRVFGGQQESGSAEVASRGDDGAVTSRDFHSVGTEEYGYVAPDPRHPWLIYGGKVTAYDERTGQTRDVSPTYDRTRYRFDRTDPLVWNRVDKRTLYLGLNVVFATSDGARTWREISPDLTRERPGSPQGLAHFARDDARAGAHRGVVYSLAPSYVDARTLWAGTDDGLVWVTRDGGARWRRCDALGLGPWSRVTQIDASHRDARTAYVAVSRQRLDDLRPYAYRTHDGGRTWRSIARGLPRDEPVNAVREDPQRPGLLFAATEKSVYVSFDDGERWASLRNDLPATSVRDLVIHGDDLVIATHGRSFWILDDIAPLRAAGPTTATAAILFAPATAVRVRRDTNTDTPLPPDEPAGENPPDGAIIDYVLPAESKGVVTLAIYDAAGRLVRSFASDDPVESPDTTSAVPAYWARPTPVPPAGAGHHRFVWDLRYPPPRAAERGYPIAAIAGRTPRAPEGVLAVPGIYEVRLTAGGRTYRRPLRVVRDPRVTIADAAFAAQFALARRIAAGMDAAAAAAAAARGRHDAAAAARYVRLAGGLGRMLEVVEAADAAPTAAATAAVARTIVGVANGGFPRVDPGVGGDEP